MRTLRTDDRPTKLAEAVAELERIDKTIHDTSSRHCRKSHDKTQFNAGACFSGTFRANHALA
jgi:hypothetical protein